jgi:hypothetical protein
MAQHVDGAALGDLSLEARQELAPRGAVHSQVEGRAHLGLRRVKEGCELDKVHAVLAVIVPRLAAGPSGTIRGRALIDGTRAVQIGGARHSRGHAIVARHCPADQCLHAAFAGVGGHGRFPRPPNVILPSINQQAILREPKA